MYSPLSTLNLIDELNKIKQMTLTNDFTRGMCISTAMLAKIEAQSFISPHMISEKANINSDSRNGYHYKSFPPTSAWTRGDNKSA